MRTITIEKIADIPEIAQYLRANRQGLLDEPRIIERMNGTFVRGHGDGSQLRNGNMIWDNARHLADRIGARYIGPSAQATLPARQVREGWYVQAGAPGFLRWHRVKATASVVSLTKGEPGARVRIEFDHHPSITVGSDEELCCRWPVGC